MNLWPDLNFTMHRLSVKKTEGQIKVHDPVRKKWLVLTPEEWVRQHLILYLHLDLGYPYSLMSTETGHLGTKGQQRTDLLVYDRMGKVDLMVECKAPHVRINHETLHQLSRYQPEVNAKILAMTNGLAWILIDTATGHTLNDWPEFTSFDQG